MSIELFLGITGTVIALAVAITTIWQGFSNRHHNRLSVTPILRITRVTVLDEKANILLKNTGFGPAIICYIKFFVDGKAIDPKLSRPTNEAVQKIGLDPPRYRLFEFRSQESLAAGEEQSLILSMNAIEDDKTLVDTQKAFDRLKIEIEYESI